CRPPPCQREVAARACQYHSGRRPRPSVLASVVVHPDEEVVGEPRSVGPVLHAQEPVPVLVQLGPLSDRHELVEGILAIEPQVDGGDPLAPRPPYATPPPGVQP